MILTQGLHRQGQAYHEKMERDLAAKTEQIRALEKVLEMAKKKTEEEETSRKAAEAVAAKVKNDFHTDRKRKSDEKKQFAADAQKIADIYLGLIHSVGTETEAPRETTVPSFMSWLANELADLESHMTMGWDHASMISLRAFAKALEDANCDHFARVEVGEIEH